MLLFHCEELSYFIVFPSIMISIESRREKKHFFVDFNSIQRSFTEAFACHKYLIIVFILISHYFTIYFQ